MERTDGPFEYYQDLHAGVTGDSIRADAHDPGLKAATIGALAGELEGDARQVAGQLSGDITADVQANPETASDTAKKLAAKGHYAVGLISSFAEMVDTFDTTVNGLNHRYRTDLAMAMRWAGQAAASTKDPEDDKQVTEAKMGPQIKANLQGEYTAAVSKLDNDADSIATKFKQGATDANVRELVKAGLIPLAAAAFYPGLKLTAADKTAYWQNTVGKMSAQEQIDWINQHKDELPPELAPAILPSVQEHFADEVAKDIKDPGDIDDDTVKMLSFLKEQPAFAHQLYSTVSPDELGDAVRTLSSKAFQTGGTPPFDMDKAELYKGFLDSAGVAFATYTKGTGALTPPADLADTWFKAITDEENPENAGALTLLIKHGGASTSLDDHFISELTGKTYEWELSHDGDPVWGPLNEKLGAGAGIMDPDLDYGDTDDSYDDRAFGQPGHDGLANLLGGMEHNPKAAQDFFLGHYDGSTQDLDQRMDYLIGGEDGRTWDSGDGSDDGDGLGRALQAATVGEDTRTVDGTKIANAMFHNIAEYGGKSDGTVTHEWHVGPNMTDSLGLIASGYSPDLYNMLHNTPPGASGDPTLDAMPHLDIKPGELTKILGEVGNSSDKTGLETLTTAMVTQCRNENVALLHDLRGPHTLMNLEGSGFSGQQEINGDVMGNLLHYGTSLWDDNDKAEQARAEMMSKAVSIAGGFVPGAGSVLGEGASELAKMTFDTVKGESLSALGDAVSNSAPSSAAEYADNASAKIPDELRYNSVSDLYRAGYLGEQDTKTGHFEGVSDELFTGDPPTLRKDLYDSNGYDLDDTNLSAADKERITKEYGAFVNNSSKVWELAYDNTYNGNFYDRMQHPTPMTTE